MDGMTLPGVKAAKILAKQFNTIDNLSEASVENLSEVEEIGPIVANSIKEFFEQQQTKDLISRLKIAG